MISIILSTENIPTTEIREIEESSEAYRLKLSKLEAEMMAASSQADNEIVVSKERADRVVDIIEKFILPVLTALFALMFIVILLFYDYWIFANLVRVIAGIFTLILSIIMGILRAKLFGIRDKLIIMISKRLRLHQFKKSL